jgi:hypothetical protein
VSADEFSYAPPEITPGTLRLNGGQPASLVIGNNSLGDLIFFRGKNFPKYGLGFASSIRFEAVLGLVGRCVRLLVGCS